MKRVVICLLLVLTAALRMFAQQAIVGRVVDAETGEPLPYASVYVSEGNGTLTNIKGDFRIMGDAGATLYISYIGYEKTAVKATNLKHAVRLKPMAKSLQEVTVNAPNLYDIVREVIAQLKTGYKKNKKHRETYFYRTVLTNGNKTELLEAFMNASSALNLRNTAILSGIRGVDENGERSKLPISNTDMHRLIEVGPQVYENFVWEGCIKPFDKLSTTKKYYNITYDYLTGENGESLIKLNFTLRRATERPVVRGIVMEGTAYIDTKDNHLMRFEGEVLNMYMRSGHSQVPEQFTFCVNYDYSQGFAEVASVNIHGGGMFEPRRGTKLSDVSYRTLVFHLKGTRLKDKEYKTGTNLLSSIRAAGYNSKLWDKYEMVRRTEEEERIAYGDSVLYEREIKQRVENMYKPYIDSAGSFQLKELIKRKALFARAIPQEKVYLHMDNTCYFMGDTIWFSAYTMSTATNLPSNISNVLYVELLNDDGYLVERKLIYMDKGHGHGYFALDKPVMYGGFYELRAYTRWQLNWGVKEHFQSYRSREWFISKELERNFFRDYDKLYSRVFPVYDKPKEPGEYNRHMTVRPLRRPSNRVNNRELQLTLFPEGGNLVEGLPCRVAYECAWSDGEAYQGEVTFSSSQAEKEWSDTLDSRGRGVFTIVPLKGDDRDVTLLASDGTKVKAKLPKVDKTGATLCVEAGDSSTWCLSSQLSADLKADTVGMSISHEGKVYAFYAYSPAHRAEGDPGYRFTFAPPKDVSGVFQATVFSESGLVLADRLFFVKAEAPCTPSLTITGLKDEYQPLERVQLSIRSTDSTALHGGLASVAVRSATASTGTFDNGSIMTEMLLSSEIRGFVPEPGWFFEQDDQKRRRSLDLLMMTQGWRRFDWQHMAVRGAWEITQPKEKRPILKGRVYKRHPADPRIQAIDQVAMMLHPEWAAGYGITGDDEESIPEEGMEKFRYEKIKEGENGTTHEYYLHAFAKDEEGEMHFYDMKTHDHGQFEAVMPSFYGDCIMHMGATGEKEYQPGKEYEWEEMYDPEYLTIKELSTHEVEPAKNLVLIDYPYPRYAKPYNYYQQQVKLPKWQEEDAYEPEEGTTMMREVAVKGTFKGLYAFSDANPTFMKDGMDVENDWIDSGMYFAPSATTKLYTGEMGLEMWPSEEKNNSRGIENIEAVEFRYGMGYQRHLLENGVEVPADSMYTRKYLLSMPTSRDIPLRERVNYVGMGLTDKLIFYTDFSPRLEGDKRYQKNFPQVHVAKYIYEDKTQRPVYRDRCFRLQGYAMPAEFYSPDYSKHALPEGQKDYRRTLYWNPYLLLDGDEETQITFYNNSQTTRLQVEAEGQARDGKLLWNAE